MLKNVTGDVKMKKLEFYKLLVALSRYIGYFSLLFGFSKVLDFFSKMLPPFFEYLSWPILIISFFILGSADIEVSKLESMEALEQCRHNNDCDKKIDNRRFPFLD
jgi:hypothetical protein